MVTEREQEFFDAGKRHILESLRDDFLDIEKEGGVNSFVSVSLLIDKLNGLLGELTIKQSGINIEN